MRKFALLWIAITLFFAQAAMAEATDITAALPMINAAVTQAQQDGITGFDTVLYEEYPAYISAVTAALKQSDAQSIFALNTPVVVDSSAAPEYSRYYGMTPMQFNNLDNNCIQVVGELYSYNDESLILTEENALKVDWVGSVTVVLEKNGSSPYQYRLLSFVIEDGSIPAFKTIEAEINFYTSDAMGVSFCYPAFMLMHYEDASLVQFTGELDVTKSKLSVYKRDLNDTSDLIPADAASFPNEEMGYVVYHFEVNGLGCFAIRHQFGGNAYILLFTYAKDQVSAIEPYFELLENAFSPDMLYNG